ncbi:MAG TPA: hypothetical protein VGL08_13085 [Paraburkholderia sp.]|jgi:hypothetical protein
MSYSISNPASLEPGKTLRTLGAFEEYVWLLEQRVSRTIVVAAEVEGPTRIESWRAALDTVQAHHTILSARIRQKPGYRPCFEYAPGAALSLQVVLRESGTRLFELLSRELSTRFAPGEVLLRATLLYGRDRSTLLLAADHAAFDGMSLVFVIRDLLRALAGEPLGSRQTMPPSHDELLGLHTNDRYATAPAAPDSNSAHGSPPCAADASGLTETDEQPLLQQIWLEPSITSVLTNRARDEETTVHGALCAAVMLAGRAHSRSWADNTVRCASPVDTRPLLGVNEQLGLRLTMRYTELEASNAPSFWDLARTVKQDVALRRTAADAAGGFFAPILDMISAGIDPDRLVMGSRQRAHTLMVSNYGRLAIRTKYGRLRLRWVTPAVMSGAPRTQTVSVATVDGLLCMTNVSIEPVPSLLGAARRLLLAQLE